MAYVQGKCPECSGMLAVDTNEKASISLYCGKAFIVQEAIELFNARNAPTKAEADEPSPKPKAKKKAPKKVTEAEATTDEAVAEEAPSEPKAKKKTTKKAPKDESKSDFIIEAGVLKEYTG